MEPIGLMAGIGRKSLLQEEEEAVDMALVEVAAVVIESVGDRPRHPGGGPRDADSRGT